MKITADNVSKLNDKEAFDETVQRLVNLTPTSANEEIEQIELLRFRLSFTDFWKAVQKAIKLNNTLKCTLESLKEKDGLQKNKFGTNNVQYWLIMLLGISTFVMENNIELKD